MVWSCRFSILQYALALCGVSVFTNAFAWIAGGAYLSSWFPTKKGLALGWATMGNNLASATIVILLTSLATAFGGIQWAITFIGVGMILLSVWAFFIPSHPEEAGATPDNLPIEEVKKTSVIDTAENKDYESNWTYKDILRTKEFWLIGISLGIYFLVTVGVMSQLVPRMIGLGFTESKAIATMTICALIGVVGSYIWGYLDIKFSTKFATAAYGIWYTIAIIFNLLNGLVFIYISIFMIGIAIGGSANWPISLTSTVYGSKNFAKVYSLINPLISIIRMLAFTVLAISLSLVGSYTGAYLFFIVLLVLAIFMVLAIDDKKYSDDYK
ncbi:MAG: MFS transporter [Lachnospirales bacterium]